MPTQILIVDAFAEIPFSGNPAGVCLLDRAASPKWMQGLARELNYSETAFIVPRRDEGFDLRWFTPAVEVDLCGHATLASAHALYETGRLDRAARAIFHTRSGMLEATSEDRLIRLDLPANAPSPYSGELAEHVADALRERPSEVLRARNKLIAIFDSAAKVAALRPDFLLVGTLPPTGVVATARAAPGDDADFVSRFFATPAGIDEDPVTGAAHCALAPLWASRLSRRRLIGRQGTSDRGGLVDVELLSDRVALRGRCITILSGRLGPITEQGALA